jgi:hypothetical protein
VGRQGLRTGIAVGLAGLFACLLFSTSASANIDAFGRVFGRDKTILRNHFLSLHPRNYRIVGYHASNAYRHKFAGVYYLRRKGGAVVDSGVTIYHQAGSGWRLIAHPSKRLRVNLDPDTFFYSASVGGSGEYKIHEATGIDEPETASSSDTDISFTLGGKIASGRDKLELTGYQEAPEPEDPKNLLTGKGKTVYTHPISSEDTPECEYTVTNPSDTKTELTIGWRGKSAVVRLNLGSPEGGAGTNCGGKIEDPKDSVEPGVELITVVPHAPLGKPFDVPLGLDHRLAETSANQETGALSSVFEKSLVIKGTLSFHLVGLEVPLLN